MEPGDNTAQSNCMEGHKEGCSMLSALADWLFGCSFPITCRAERTETYMVCLECGTRIMYDGTLMYVAKPRTGDSLGRHNAIDGWEKQV